MKHTIFLSLLSNYKDRILARMVSYRIIAGLLSLSFLAGGVSLAADNTASTTLASSAIKQNSFMIENEYITVNVHKVGRRLAAVTIQDKINGRTYDLGSDIFALTVCDEATDEACSKKSLRKHFTPFQPET